jgi:hypothetical protein
VPEGALVREQESLDDPVRPARWRETLAWRVTGFTMTPLDGAPVGAGDGAGAGAGVTAVVTPRVLVHVEAAGETTDREIWVK